MRAPVLVAFLLAVLPMGATHAKAGSDVELFLSLPEAEFETVALRLEYLGPQDESIPSLFVTLDGRAINWDAFYSVPEIQLSDYEINWRQSKPTFTASSQDMQNFLRGILPLLNEPPEQPRIEWLSLTLVAGSDSPFQHFYHVFSRRQASDLFVYLRGAFRADPKDISIVNGGINTAAMVQLQSLGCAIGLISDAIPARDVSGLVNVTRSGLRFNPIEHRFESTITLNNMSERSIRGPISLVVDTSANVELGNAHGHTCITSPIGRAFLTLPMPQDTFNPGQALETTLWFHIPQGQDIDFTTKVLAGAGER